MVRAGLASVALLVLTACGRIGFDLSSEGLTDAAVDGTVTLTKLTPEAPIFMASNDPADDYYYLISTRGAQRASSFVYNEEIYFAIPSKSTDASSGGWHYGMAHWSPGNDSAAWYDASGSPGQQAVVLSTSLDSNGFLLRNHKTANFVDIGTGIFGLSDKYFSSAEYPDVITSGFYWTPIRAASPESFVASDIDVAQRKLIEIADNDGSWRGATLGGAELFRKDGTLYVYQTQINTPANNTFFVALTTSTDLFSFDQPTTFLLEGYARPQVFEFHDSIYMVAFNYPKLQWQLIPGSAPDAFHPEQAVDLELGSQLLGSGKWDDSVFFTDLPGGEPRLAGVDVLGDTIYIFYLAGGFAQLPADPNSGGAYHGVPYDGPRGIGVFTLRINP